MAVMNVGSALLFIVALVHSNPAFEVDAIIPMTLIEIRELLESWQQKPICEVHTLGKKEFLKMIIVGEEGRRKKKVWIDAGIHGNDMFNPLAVIGFLDDLVNNWEKHPDFIRDIEWHVVPVLNPDGYEYSLTQDPKWSKNCSKMPNEDCIGVDLDRNFSFDWKSDPQDNCSDDYAGPGAFSEPETAAIRDHFNKCGEGFFNAFLTIRSGGQMVCYVSTVTSHGGDETSADLAQRLMKVATNAASEMTKIDETPYTAHPIAAISGSSFGWAFWERKIEHTYKIESADQTTDAIKETNAAIWMIASEI